MKLTMHNVVALINALEPPDVPCACGKGTIPAPTGREGLLDGERKFIALVLRVFKDYPEFHALLAEEWSRIEGNLAMCPECGVYKGSSHCESCRFFEKVVRHAEMFPGADTAALDKDPHFAGYDCVRCGGGPWMKFAEVPEFCVRRKP